MGKDASKRHQRSRRQRRYIFHSDEYGNNTRIHLVYYFKDKDVILASDGPFFDESRAIKKMKEHLLRGRCAWMVVYNE